MLTNIALCIRFAIAWALLIVVVCLWLSTMIVGAAVVTGIVWMLEFFAAALTRVPGQGRSRRQ